MSVNIQTETVTDKRIAPMYERSQASNLNKIANRNKSHSDTESNDVIPRANGNFIRVVNKLAFTASAAATEPIIVHTVTSRFNRFTSNTIGPRRHQLENTSLNDLAVGTNKNAHINRTFEFET